MIHIPISVGELIDKITILEIKSKKIHDEEKLLKVHYELEKLSLIAYQFMEKKEIVPLYEELLDVNKELWRVEDELRIIESKKYYFNENFIQLARSVYMLNDIRFNVKNKINSLTGSDIQEVKQYVDYK